MIELAMIPSPCYVLDERLLRENLALIRSVAERAGVKIIIAFKGFALWQTFDIVRAYVDTAAVSSVNEALLCHQEMQSKGHAYAPAYSQQDIDTLIPIVSHISFNSLSQLVKFAPQVRAKDPTLGIGLRINPEYSDVSVALYNPSSADSRLGILAEHMPEKLPDYVDGLHFHTLCESTSYALENTLQAVEERFGAYLQQVKWINMGGGHLLTSATYNVEHLISLLQRFKKKHKLDIILEPGSAFAWQTGFLVSSVQDIVKGRNVDTAILDVSFTCHMPDCLEMPYKPEVLGASEPEPGKPEYRLGGNSCLAGDYMGNWSFDKPLRIGDKVVFNDMIHYTLVKTTMFNGVSHPSIGMLTSEGTFQLLRKFAYEDYKSRLG